MFFWIREAAGWLLVLFALYLIRQGLIFVSDLDNPKIIEAGIVILGGVGVMRAGILLIRISTAARAAKLT